MDLRRAVHRSIGITALVLSSLLSSTSVSHATPPADSTPESVPVGDTTTPASDDSASADAGSFAVQPSGPNGPGGRDYFVYTLKVGEVYQDTVSISNVGTNTATFSIYATDAQNTSDGSFSLLREEASPEDVGTWVELGATQWTVEPGMRVDIPFTVTVPADVAPGDHVGAILAQKIDDPDDPNDGIGFDVRVRVGARLYVRVDGPVNPSLAIDEFAVSYSAPGTPFSGADARVTYTVTNTGDIRLSPVAALAISGAFGLGETAAPDRQLPELLPGSSIQISEVLRDVKPYLRITADLNIQSAGAVAAASSSITQWAVPVLAVIGFAAIGFAFIAWRVAKRRRASV